MTLILHNSIPKDPYTKQLCCLNPIIEVEKSAAYRETAKVLPENDFCLCKDVKTAYKRYNSCLKSLPEVQAFFLSF